MQIYKPHQTSDYTSSYIFYTLVCTSLTVLTEKGHSTRDVKQDLCLSFDVKKSKAAFFVFFIAPLAQPGLQVTLNSEALLSKIEG